jgi:hypothetical protein
MLNAGQYTQRVIFDQIAARSYGEGAAGMLRQEMPRKDRAAQVGTRMQPLKFNMVISGREKSPIQIDV